MACAPTPLMGESVAKLKGPLPSSYDPDRDVLIRYDPPAPDMKPHGFSGGGVWCDPAERPGAVWSADPLLFGVQTHAYMESGLLKAVGRPPSWNFLKSPFKSHFVPPVFNTVRGQLTATAGPYNAENDEFPSAFEQAAALLQHRQWQR
jgi:hypothetical protein